MSWQDYVDKQLLASGFVNHAAIIGSDGSLWAKSAAFNVIFIFYFTLPLLIVSSQVLMCVKSVC